MVKLNIILFIQKKNMEIDSDKTYDFNYIYVLDYSDASIYEIHIDENEHNMEIEDIIEKHGCNINTCSWMLVESQIETIISI